MPHRIIKIFIPKKEETFEIDFSSDSEPENKVQLDSTFICELCGFQKETTSIQKYKYYHMANWHKDGKIDCAKCQIVFRKEKQLARHLAEEHEEFLFGDL